MSISALRLPTVLEIPSGSLVRDQLARRDMPLKTRTLRMSKYDEIECLRQKRAILSRRRAGMATILINTRIVEYSNAAIAFQAFPGDIIDEHLTNRWLLHRCCTYLYYFHSSVVLFLFLE